MKKVVLFSLSILAGGALHALPVGNPAEPALHLDGLFCMGHTYDPFDPCETWCTSWSFRIGFYGDYIFNRRLETNRYDDHSDLHDVELITNAGYLALNFWDRIDLFGTLGATGLWIDGPGQPILPVGTFLTPVRGGDNFSWSVGLRGVIWECGRFTFGGEGQYFQSNIDIEWVIPGNVTPFFADDVTLKYADWQLALGAAYRIDLAVCGATAFVPYFGVRVGHAHLNGSDQEIPGPATPVARFSDYRSQRDWGWAIGSTLLACERLSLTVEGRFVSEKALYVNGQFRF